MDAGATASTAYCTRNSLLLHALVGGRRLRAPFPLSRAGSKAAATPRASLRCLVCPQAESGARGLWWFHACDKGGDDPLYFQNSLIFL